MVDFIDSGILSRLGFQWLILPDLGFRNHYGLVENEASCGLMLHRRVRHDCGVYTNWWQLC